WLNHALRMLEFIVSKDSTIYDFLLLSFFPIPLWLVVALPMSAFIGVIWVISRFLSDRELIVMQAVGFTPLQFGRVPIVFGAALTFALLINSVYILPASFSTFKEVQAEVRGSLPKLLIQDNVFIDIADDLTLFVGERINQNEVGRVFIQDSRNPEITITFTSERGQFSSVNGQPVFLLLNGQRTELRKDGTSNAQLTFETHSLDISQQNTGAAERVILDMNEDSIRNLLNPDTAISPRYARERMAMGHYRLSAPFMALALTILAAAIMLQGHISREKLGRRVLIAALTGVAVQTLSILARSATVGTPVLWPLMYLAVLIPIGAGVFMLWRPFWMQDVYLGLTAQWQQRRRPEGQI
ncbi:MAG: LptF/LptG family permease, partial [Candidatus Puniceispirillaceae bacterium]